MSDKTISVASVSKVIALITSIIAAWIFLTSNFVSAADYREDSLVMQATLVEINLDIIEDRLDRETDEARKEKLKHRRAKLERQQEIIMERQLDQ